MSWLILFYALFYTIMAWRRPAWALMLLIAALPSYLIRFNILGLPSTLLELMILSSTLTWFIKNREALLQKFKLSFDKKRKKINYPFGLEAIALLVFSFASVLFFGLTDNALGEWKAYFFEPILIFILALNILSIRKIVLSLGFSAFLIAGFALFQALTNMGMPIEWLSAGRATSFFPYPNAIGLYLAPLILIFGGFIFSLPFKENKLIAFFLSLTAGLSLLAIYLARSEGALIGVLAGLFFFALFFSKKSAVFALIFAFCLSLIVLNAPALKSYALEKITLSDLSGEIRKQQWSETWQMLQNNIFWGAGLANYQVKIAPYHQPGIFFNFSKDPDFQRKIVIFDEKYKADHWQPAEIYLYPHNIILNFWSEIGLAGLLVFISLFARFFYLGFKFKKTERGMALGLMSGMAALIVHGLVDVPYFKNDLAILFWLILALMGFLKLKSSNCLNE